MAYTSFFRDTDALAGIGDVVIPALAHWRSIRVWDAGCATGEEPFTLAILFATRLRPFPFRNLDILATDYEESSFPQFAARIESARYTRQDIFWVPEPLRAAYFVPTEDPERFQLVPEIRERVRYRQHDLLTLAPPETGQSLIVCKNVLMHFSAEGQAAVLEMFFQALVPGGYLALDGAQALPPAFAGRFERVGPEYPVYRKPEA
jgi:chemotaxis protein methyltransferase CheR